MNNHKIIAFVILLTSIFSYGQDTILISKSELSEKVKNNLQLKISQNVYESSKQDYKQTNSLFLPNINLSHTGILTTNPLMAFGSKLNQEILTTSDFNPAVLNDPAKTQNFATKIEVQQPLINLDGLYSRKAAKAKMEAYDYQSQRTNEYIELEITKAFMQLQLAYKATKVYERAENTAKANLKLVENYFKQGMIQKTDVLNVQIRVNEVSNQFQQSKSAIQNASDYLAFLINENSRDKILKPVENLDEAIVIEEVSTEISTNRKDIQAMTKSSEAYKNMELSSKYFFLPKLNAFGSYEMYDHDFLGTSAKGYLVGAQISWNVFDGNKSIAAFHKSKIESEKASTELDQYKKKSQLELNKTNRQLNDANNKVATTKLGFEQSQEAFRIRQNRFTQGLEKTTDLLQTETQLYQKELEYLQAVFEYNYIKQYVQFLTK